MPSQPHGIQQNARSPTHQPRTPHSPHHSMAYSSAPLAPPQDFQLPNSTEMYGVSYSSNESDVHGFGVGVNSAPTTATMPEHTLEPESYYKSEPESRRISISQHVGQQTPRTSLPFSPTAANHPHQQYATLASSQQASGVKRRRDEAGEEPNASRTQLGANLSSSQRRRSFTLPSGYSTSSGH